MPRSAPERRPERPMCCCKEREGVCLKGIRERRGKPRPDMPWVEDPGDIDAEFLEFVKNYPVQSRPRVQELLRRYSQKEILQPFLKRRPFHVGAVRVPIHPIQVEQGNAGPLLEPS